MCLSMCVITEAPKGSFCSKLGTTGTGVMNEYTSEKYATLIKATLLLNANSFRSIFYLCCFWHLSYIYVNTASALNYPPFLIVIFFL
jgi:hypothetical protein